MAIYDAPCLTKITLDNWRYFGQVEVLWTTGDTLDSWRCSGQLEILWTTGGALDNWKYFGQLEVLLTTGDTLDNWRCSRQLEVLWTSGGQCSRQLGVLWTSGGAFDNCRYPGQPEVLSTTGDPTMPCKKLWCKNQFSIALRSCLYYAKYECGKARLFLDCKWQSEKVEWSS